MTLLRLPLLSLAVLALSAQTLPPGVVQKTTLAGITEYAYANGLRVLLYPNPSSPKVTVNVTYLVGSRHEGYGETGMAHLLEHMNFIDTVNGRHIKNEIVGRGAAWNGTTSYDRTNYFETVTASDENLKWALGLETDRMVNVKFTKQILDTEMTVVRNEFERGENSPQSILRERVAATAYIWHNYGKTTIGSKADLEKVPVERLEAFYRKYYQPDNAVLVITGKIEPAKALAAVAETMGKLPRPSRALDQTYTVEPPQDGERFVELRRVGEGQAVMVAYHGPAAGHPDSAALQVLAGVLNGGGRGFGGGGGGTGRLRKALVDPRKADSAMASAMMLHDPGLITLSAGLNKDQSADDVRRLLIETAEGLASDPPSKQELERVTANLLRSLEDELADPQSLAMGALNTAIAQGDWRLMFLAHDRLKDVNPQDVQRVAKAYLKASNRTVGYFKPDASPDRAVVPDTPDLVALLKDYKTTVSITHAEAFDPSPASIEGRLQRSRLSGGTKLVLFPQQTEAGMVHAFLELRFGGRSTLTGNTAVAQMTGALLGVDTKSKSREQLADELRKLNARVQVSAGGAMAAGGGRGGRGGFGPTSTVASAIANITVPAANFDAALRLAVEMLREPGMTAAEFERLHTARLKALENPQTEPVVLAAETLSRQLSPWDAGDPLYPETREKQLAAMKEVTLDRVKQFHSRFYGANDGVLAVIGPVDAAQVKTTAEQLLGTWNSQVRYQPMEPAYRAAAPVNRKIETPDKANAQFEAGMRFKMADKDPEYAAMILAGYMFGGSITSRVSDRIRNREGLSYGANARVTVPADGGDSSALAATVSLNPANGPKVEAAYLDELKKAVEGGFTGPEVDAAKKAYLDARSVARSQVAQLPVTLANLERRSRTMAWEAQLEDKIRALTAADVNTAFRKLIDPRQLTIIKAGDFKAAGVYQ